MDNFKYVISNYKNFEGREIRSNFFYAFLLPLLSGFVYGMIYGILGEESTLLFIFGIFFLFWFLFTLLVFLSAAVRRIHDIGGSGWLAVLLFIPGVAPLLILVLLIKKGTAGPNKWGEDPLNQVTDTTKLI